MKWTSDGLIMIYRGRLRAPVDGPGLILPDGSEPIHPAECAATAPGPRGDGPSAPVRGDGTPASLPGVYPGKVGEA